MSESEPLLQLSEDELLDTLYKILADRQRRRILRYLTDHPEPVSTSQLATEILTLEYGSELSAISEEQQSDTHVSLLHIHLPVLNKAGILHWDRETDSVAISPTLQELVVTTTGNILDLSVSVNNTT
jgi:DNA-binding transcriptional ArsR family regulator